MKSFKIYQLPIENDAKFMRYEFVEKHNIMPKLQDYKMVYEGEIEDGGRNDMDVCDQIWGVFNCGTRPEGYTGHSLSVSDVVEVDGKYYYCDSFGWQRVSFEAEVEDEEELPFLDPINLSWEKSCKLFNELAKSLVGRLSSDGEDTSAWEALRELKEQLENRMYCPTNH